MKKFLLLFSLFPFFPLSASAQSDDFGLDFELEVEKKLSKQWSLGLEGEVRTRDNTKTMDRWSGGLSVDYKIAKWLKASAGYTFLYDNNEKITYKTNGAVNKEAHYWGVRHRFNVSLTGSQKFGNFKFSLRERWQYTYRPEYTVDERWSYLKNAYDGKAHTYSGKGKHVLRSRLQVEYDNNKVPVSPYASVEFFNQMSLEKVRYQVGAEWSLTKQHAVGAFYRYQHISNDDEEIETNRHLIGLSYKLKL